MSVQSLLFHEGSGVERLTIPAPGAPETKADVADQWVGVMKISRTLARLGA